MKLFSNIGQVLKKKVMICYHRQMASALRKYAAYHADLVIHTQHRVPNASLAKMRGYAAEHDQKAKAIRLGE